MIFSVYEISPAEWMTTQRLYLTWYQIYLCNQIHLTHDITTYVRMKPQPLHAWHHRHFTRHHIHSCRQHTIVSMTWHKLCLWHHMYYIWCHPYCVYDESSSISDLKHVIIQASFGKGRGTRDQMLTSSGSLEKQESSRKTSISAFLTTPKSLTVWITKNCGKFLDRWEYQTTWFACWETYTQVRKQQLEPDMEQQTGSKYEKEYLKYIVTLLIWRICRVHHEKRWAGWSISWSQDCQEKYQ